MTTISGALKTMLSADATLAGILTGGIYRFDEPGMNGISPKSLAAAYDTDKFLKPCAVIHQRSNLKWGGMHDSANQVDSMRAVVEIFVYDDAARSYDNVVAGRLRIGKLLEAQFLPGFGWMKEINELAEQRDPLMQNAVFHEVDYQVVYSRYL